MSTKNNWIVLSVKINWFYLPLMILPIRCAEELIEGVYDILSLFSPFSKKFLAVVDVVDGTLIEVKKYGNLDLVDVDAVEGESNTKVKVKIRLR